MHEISGYDPNDFAPGFRDLELPSSNAASQSGSTTTVSVTWTRTAFTRHFVWSKSLIGTVETLYGWTLPDSAHACGGA
jgi:hypothetical protein